MIFQNMCKLVKGGGGIILVKVFKICQEIIEDSIIP